MKETKITFETAKLAKEKGFQLGSSNSYCQYHTDYNYDNDPSHRESYKKGQIQFLMDSFMINDEKEIGDFSNEYYTLYEAPSQTLLQKWLREKHNIDVYIVPSGASKKLRNNLYHFILWYKDEYQTESEVSSKIYEEAMERGLFTALRLLP